MTYAKTNYNIEGVAPLVLTGWYIWVKKRIRKNKINPPPPGIHDQTQY